MTTTAPSAGNSPSQASLLTFLRQNLSDYSMLLTLVVIMVFFQIVTGGVLFKPVNLTNLIMQNSFVVIMALGMLLVIVAGGIDLSVGSIVAVVGAVGSVMMVTYKIDPWLTTAVCLVFGAAIGAAQGYWVAYHRVPAFIVTLAGMLFFRGLTLYVLGGMNLGPFPVAFQKISTGFLPDLFPMGGLHSTSVILTVAVTALLVFMSWRSRRINEAHGIEVQPLSFFAIQNGVLAAILLFLGYQLSTYKGFPVILLIMGLLIALYSFATTNMTIGRRVYALGGNAKATQLSGINTERLYFLTFVNMGVLAAFAALIVAARLNSSTPKAGTGFELDVIAACFIGGASVTGGSGKVTGAVVGAFIMGVLNNGMSIMGLGVDYQQIVKGLVLLAAVVFDLYNKKKG